MNIIHSGIYRYFLTSLGQGECHSCHRNFQHSAITQSLLDELLNQPLPSNITLSPSPTPTLTPTSVRGKKAASSSPSSPTTRSSRSSQTSPVSAKVPPQKRFSENGLLRLFAKQGSNTQATNNSDDRRQAKRYDEDEEEIPEWKRRKAAIRAKIGEGQRWNPPRKVSPDAQMLMRTLNSEQPKQFTPNVLRKHFGISYESVRRILKADWQPQAGADGADAEADFMDRKRRAWHARGKEIWSKWAEEGHKPPAMWRREGVGSIRIGKDLDGVPSWKKDEWIRRKSWWEREVEGKVFGEKMAKNGQKDEDDEEVIGEMVKSRR